VQEADSVTHMFSLIATEGAVTLVPSYIQDLPAAGVKMIPVADAEARWDFLLVWQRGRTARPLQTLIEAPSTTENAALGRTVKAQQPLDGKDARVSAKIL